MSRGRILVVNVAEAKARFSELLRRAGAGEEVVIARDHRPIAKLTAVVPTGKRHPGSAQGRVKLAPDFDATPEDFGDYLG